MCIRQLVEKIYEEIEDAQSYTELALEYKNEDRVLGEAYIQLAKDEMAHMNKLHDQVSREITEWKNNNPEAPQGMLGLYEYEHGKMIECAAKVQLMINTYK